MKLEYNVFPKFYKTYDWLAEEEEDKLFTGREYYLKNFWRNLSNVSNKRYSRQNKTFIGQRKLGKTAFLVRCYNVAFWEQDEVIPFYYCFPQIEELNLREIANEIAFKLLRQAVAYITKDKGILEEEEEEVLFYILEEKNYPWLKKLIMYWNINKKQRETCKPSLILDKVWKLVKIFSGLFNKKCLLIIDEYQKTVQDLLDEDGKPVACHESIGRVVNDRNILTMISGSQTSMLAYDVLTPELHNRIPGEKFAALMEEEVHELVLEYAGKGGYKGIEHDAYKLTGGNPYYIKTLFTPTNKYFEYHKREKSWKSKKELEELYNFEMLHMEGEVFQFWRKHINEKHHLLNNDPPKHKGATLRLLKYIAEKDEQVHIEELKEKFPEITDMRERLGKLRQTDLILDSVDSEEIMNFSDYVLPVVMTKMHQKIILGTTSKAAFKKYKEEWFETLQERIDNDIKMTKEVLNGLQKEVKELQNGVKSAKEERQELQKII